MKLDIYQEEIVKSTAQHIVVISGAGSGKTRVLTERIKWLIEQGNDPKKIVAITFTNFAADEMRERLGDICKEAFIGTTHSYANRLLIKNGYDTSAFIENDKFDKFFEAIEEHPEVIEEVDFLLVDEYQDVNANQVSFFEMINAKNTFVVGDDWQCIFTFSGSDPQYFKDAAADPKNTVYYLKNNYRTPRKIVKFATEFLRPIKNKIKKTTSCQVEEEGILEEVYDDLPQIVREIEKNGEFGKWFVLTRSNDQITEVMDILQHKKIPCDTFKKGEAGHEDIQRRMKENTVKVLTIHSAKGLENDYVAVYRMSLGERVKEEERFVAYVAATRARKRLIWCYWNSGNKKRKPQIVSWEK